MDFSRLNTRRVVVGAIASALLIVAILFLPWYSYDLSGIEKPLSEADAWICGDGRDLAAPASRPSRSCAGCCCWPRSRR